MNEHPIRLAVTDDLERSRLTSFFRFILAIPHVIWFLLWSLVAAFASAINWLATLIMGRSPQGLHSFLAAYLRYRTHYYAYVRRLANPYPGFTGAQRSYPVDLRVAGPEPQNRLKTLFRFILAIPAQLLALVLGTVLAVIGFLAFWVVLVLGRMPEGMQNLGAYCLRYQEQTVGYAMYLTDRYPSLAGGPAAVSREA